MYRANQEALFQTTNQGLIAIRNSEIQFYLTVNNTIGTQAALIGGFTYGVFTQNSARNDDAALHVQTAYFIVTAVTIASSVHVIINTMLLQVMGPGLALNGPVGSMARAATGMKIEQQQVVYAFTLMMMTFAVSTTLSFWVVEDFWGALFSTLVFAIAARFWYFHCKRILLRFWWDDSNAVTDFSRSGSTKKRTESEILDEEDDEPKVNIEALQRARAALQQKKQLGGKVGSEGVVVEDGKATDNKGNINNNNINNNTNNKRKSVSQRLMLAFGGTKEGPTEGGAAGQDIQMNPLHRPGSSSSSSKARSTIEMQGFLTKLGVSHTEHLKTNVADSWTRRYFVLNAAGEMYYYKSRMAFKEDAVANRLKERPIDVKEHWVKVEDCSGSGSAAGRARGVAAVGNNNNNNNDGGTAAGASGAKFEILLESKDGAEFRVWHLRCDTEEELALWLEALERVCPDNMTGTDI